MQEDLLMRSEPILLATNGTKDADAAVSAADQLSEMTGRQVTVIAVLEPPPHVASENGFVVSVDTFWADRRNALHARVRRQILEVAGCDPGWPIEIRTGNPAGTIANAAASLDAAVIVMGLGKQHLLDRAIGSETTLHTLRAACAPILAVPPTFAILPQRAVVATDFGDAAVAAAQEALALIPSLTDLLVLHVAPRWDMQPAAYAQWGEDYRRAVDPAMERVINELDAPFTVTVTREIREGKVTKQLFAAADEFDAQLFIVGSKGLGLLERMLVGSTASGIMRGAQDAVFAFPIAALATHGAKFATTGKETSDT
ncbi:MAG: universal stress protein [Gemmatimonadaceae bacterium]